ncbi:MAG: hypothetical protein H7Y00_02470 [Fimbriimonadaceae bacterium]|nr:hypothetical protein [Chitinophagales bacterium]
MFSRTLSFTAESSITFQCGNNDVEIYVSGTPLGKINANFAVTIYVSVDGSGNKTITMDEITNTDYLYNNTTNRTILFNQQYQNNNLHVSKCSSSNRFVIIGTDDELMGISCQGGDDAEEYFDISSAMNFKAKMEQTTVNNQTVNRVFVRYGQDIKVQCGTNPVCGSALFCYKCLS